MSYSSFNQCGLQAIKDERFLFIEPITSAAMAGALRYSRLPVRSPMAYSRGGSRPPEASGQDSGIWAAAARSGFFLRVRTSVSRWHGEDGVVVPIIRSWWAKIRHLLELGLLARHPYALESVQHTEAASRTPLGYLAASSTSL